MRRAALATLTVCLITAGVTLLGAALARSPGGLPHYVVVKVLYGAPLALAFSAIGAAILRRQPRHPVGWSLGLVGLTAALGIFAEGYAAWLLPGLDWVLWGWMVLNNVQFAGLAAALLMFPTGGPPGRRWRWLGRGLVLYVVLCALVSAFAPWPRRDGFIVLFVEEWRGWPSAHPLGWTGPPWLVGLESSLAPVGALLIFFAAVSLGPRWRKSTGEERQQIKWLVLAVLVVVLELALGISQVLFGVDSADPVGELIGTAVFILVIASVPVAIGLAITRFHLYDVDTIISRTLVFGGLAVVLAGAYLAAVVLSGQMVGHVGRTSWLSAGSTTLLVSAATASVALAFDLIRQRLQRLADRMVFGARAVPYELIAGFGARLSAAVAPSEVLTSIAEASARAVRGQAATVTVSLAQGDTVRASWPVAASAFDLSIPMHDGDTVLGQIQVKAGGTHPADVALLRDVAAVAKSALRNLRLDSELLSLRDEIDRRSLEVVASRRRLDDAQRSERHRLSEHVADHIKPDLDALGAALASARSDPSRAGLDALGEQAARLVDEVRSLSRGIRPPILADHGLVAALRACLRRVDAHVTLDVDASLVDARLPDPIETAVYLVCSDAIASARGAVSVRLRRHDGGLDFEVSHEVTGPIRVPAIAADRLAALGGDLHLAQGRGLTGHVPLS